MKQISVSKYIIAVIICAVFFLAGGCSSVESGSVIDNTNSTSGIEQKEVSSEARFNYYPSGADFVASVIDQRDTVEITEEMRESFNLFARDYRWIYVPDMDGYESFFETTHYGSSYGYTNFAGAVFYVLHYMGCPEKMSDEAMQDAIQSLFAAKAGYEKMPHQAYRKFASYEDGYYSPWPEGGIDHNRMFYLLTAMDVHHDAAEDVKITVRVTSYYFEDTSVFEAGENEKWLAEKSEKLGIPELQAAAKLIASGEMGELEGEHEFETTMYIKGSVNNPRGLNPQFISSRSRALPYDDPF